MIIPSVKFYLQFHPYNLKILCLVPHIVIGGILQWEKLKLDQMTVGKSAINPLF
jgi:hypothetical protein